MGALAQSLTAYAKPLLDQTDGSIEKLNNALMIAQMCWNLSLLTEDERETEFSHIRLSLKMSDAEFEAFRRDVLVPMIRRHEEMFPGMSRGPSTEPPTGPARGPIPFVVPASPEKFPGTPRKAPCPCGSGRKYKRCCAQ